MANLKLYPPYGTIEESNSIKFEISDIEFDKFHIKIENVTHGVDVVIDSFQDMGNNSYMGIMNLNIPEHSSQSSISIFAYIDELQGDGSYKTKQICPSIFTIQNISEKIDKDNQLIVTPSFIGQKDLCSVRVEGEPNTKVIFSINDKIFKIIINNDGYGSIHFKGRDIVGDKELESINKFPIHIYRENYTNKVFSGSYLNILPSTIALHAEIDPRCDPASSSFVGSSWVRPEECKDISAVCDSEIEICNYPEVCIPPIDIPTSCNSGDIIVNSNICRIHNNSVVLLNNGMVLYAYTSPDKSYTSADDDERNINRVFIAAHKTSIDVQIITNKDVIVESKEATDDFRIHVEQDVFNISTDLENDRDVYVVLHDELIGFQKIKIIDKIVDEYTGEYILIGEAGNSNVTLNSWIFCVNAVFYHGLETPTIYIGSTNNEVVC